MSLDISFTIQLRHFCHGLEAVLDQDRVPTRYLKHPPGSKAQATLVAVRRLPHLNLEDRHYGGHQDHGQILHLALLLRWQVSSLVVWLGGHQLVVEARMAAQ